ncbi:AbrB/MazE/SpoVT family DNA-binding domain-containing protein [Streptomyces nigra]|uniref:AbrB/MazE/SpoVT family DNA-binding domain-containing protein n=1 Tax=Streptomyces TaxID=1883 RepID=UPI00369CD9AF
MIREPSELTVGPDGQVTIPLGLLAEAGLDPGAAVLAYSSGDGVIVLRRAEDAAADLLDFGQL